MGAACAKDVTLAWYLYITGEQLPRNSVTGHQAVTRPIVRLYADGGMVLPGGWGQATPAYRDDTGQLALD